MQNIIDTGVRGYLMWLKQDQPGLYALVAPQIAQQVPEAFSDYEQSMVQGSLMGFADDTPFYVGITPYTGQAQASSTDSSTTTTATTDSTPDVVSAANSGPTDASIVSAISNIVSAASKAYTDYSTQSIVNQASQLQLQRMAAGLPPANLSTKTLGASVLALTTPSTGGGIGGGAIVAVLALIGFAAFASRGRKSSTV